MKLLKSSRKNSNFTEGPLFPPFLKFGIAILISNLAQSLYTTTDSIIIGKFSGDPNALASMSSTGTIHVMLITTILNLTVGTTIVLARAHGEKNSRAVSEYLHTSLTFACSIGLIFGILGQFLTMPILRLVNTKPELIENANTYISILLLGLPFAALAAFADVSLRAREKGAQATSITLISGILNVVLNVIFVSGLGMSVSGVAIATVISQAFSAVVALFLLSRDGKDISFSFKKIGIDLKKLSEVLKIGIPNAMNTLLISAASLVTSFTLNSLDIDVIRAGAIVGSSMNLLAMMVSAFTISAVSVSVAQNYGAKKFDRIDLTIRYSALSLTSILLIILPIYFVFPKTVFTLFADTSLIDFDVIFSYAIMILITSVICNVNKGYTFILSSASRALGHPMSPLVISIAMLGFNVLWCILIYPLIETPLAYYIAFVISSTLGLVASYIVYLCHRAKVKKELEIAVENREMLTS